MKRLSGVIFFLIVVVSLSLQLWAASQRSYWEDEAFIPIIASRGPIESTKVADWDVHPPYHFIVTYWGKIFGFEELALRFLSILFLEFALFLTYILARAMLGPSTALYSVALLAFSPLFVMFGYNARYYSFAAMLALLVVYSMWRYQTNAKLAYLALYIASSILFLYLLFAALFVIIACNIWWFLIWWQKKGHSRSRLLIWILAQSLILAGFIPGLQVILGVMQRAPEVASTSNWLTELIKRFIYTAYVFCLGETLSPLNPLAWLGGLVIVGTALLAIKYLRHNHDFWLPVILVVMIVLSGLLVSMNAILSLTWQNLPVRAFYVLPFLAIWLGAGLASLKPRWSILAGALIALVYGVGIYNFFTGAQYLRPIFTVPWRTVFQEIRDHAQPGAFVVCGEGDEACGYYSNRYGFGNLSLSDWQVSTNGKAQEIWWIDINLGRTDPSKEREKATLDQLAREYAAVSKTGYGKQDPSIRQLRSKFMGQDNYEYRVVVYRFYYP